MILGQYIMNRNILSAITKAPILSQYPFLIPPKSTTISTNPHKTNQNQLSYQMDKNFNPDKYQYSSLPSFTTLQKQQQQQQSTNLPLSSKLKSSSKYSLKKVQPLPLQSYQHHQVNQQNSKSQSNNNSNTRYFFSTKKVLSIRKKYMDTIDKEQINENSKKSKEQKSSQLMQSESLLQSQLEIVSQKSILKSEQMIDQNENTKNQPKNTSLSKQTKKQDKIIQTFNKIKQWRSFHIAPVDTVGCEQLFDKNQSQLIRKYQILIALILSVQTKDQITGKLVQRLKNYGLNPDNISAMKQQKLLELIHESNFNRKKAKNILQISKQIQKNNGIIPKTMPQLLQYPGVGLKIATLYLKIAQNINEGIGVDTHVHRIVNRLGWVKNAKNPNQTEKQLRGLFPKQYWDFINVVLVGFGQNLCAAKKPKCGECPVKRECPSRIGSGLDF